MVFLTAVIAATGIVGIILVIKGSEDGHKMLVAAEQQACAAQRFAKSAEMINEGIRSASRQAADRALQDSRPWVGLRESSCENCTLEDYSRPGRAFGILENTGKTPAIEIRVDWAVTTQNAAQPVPSYDKIMRFIEKPPFRVGSSLRGESRRKAQQMVNALNNVLSSEIFVIPPGATHPMPMLDVGTDLGNVVSSELKNNQITYAVGRVTYQSPWRDGIHTTNFCMREIPQTTQRNVPYILFKFCTTGNSMN
jgi:hypothetical protein